MPPFRNLAASPPGRLCSSSRGLYASPIWIPLVGGVSTLRPCEKTQIEEEKYCKQHKHERTSTWNKNLYDFAKKVCDLYPLTCDLCNEEGHFNFQCWHFDDRIVSPFCDETITSNLYDE